VWGAASGLRVYILGLPLTGRRQTGYHTGRLCGLALRRQPALHGVQGSPPLTQRLLPRLRIIPVQIQGRLQARGAHHRRPSLRGHCRHPPPLLARHHAQGLPQRVSQEILRLLHPGGAPPQGARIQGRP
jgi:hypothetical protein